MSVESYIASRAAFAKADKDVGEIATMVTHVGNALANQRGRFSFSNTSVGLPANVALNGQSTDGDKWVSAVQIMELLARWHLTRDAVRGDWSALSKDEKEALQPPPIAAENQR